MTIKPDEKLLAGRWEFVEGRVTADETCKRISVLTSTTLKEIGRDQSGWETLYLDLSDGRYWELTYPQSNLEGGGPPQLENISEDQAKQKYLVNP